MRILILGSKGFIGSHLYDYYSSLHKVECHGCDIVQDSQNTNYLEINPNEPDYSYIFSRNDYDYCINCSGAANVPDSFKNPFKDYMLNSTNVIKILEAIKAFTPKCKFLNMSSAAVYGNPSDLPVCERAECNPVSPYGIHKLFAENICKEYFNFFGIRSTNVRIFSAYGPRLRKQIIWDLSQNITHDEIKLWGNGNETRDFVFIKDIVQAIDIIIKSDLFENDVFNIGSGCATSINQLASLFLKLLNCNNTIKYTGSERVGDPISWEADIKKLKDWGYKPAFSIEMGLKEYIKWLKEEKLL